MESVEDAGSWRSNTRSASAKPYAERMDECLWIGRRVGRVSNEIPS